MDNMEIRKYYKENGEYWKVNTYGSRIKQHLFNNSFHAELDGFHINSYRVDLNQHNNIQNTKNA